MSPVFQKDAAFREQSNDTVFIVGLKHMVAETIEPQGLSETVHGPDELLKVRKCLGTWA